MTYDLNITPRHSLVLSLDAISYTVRYTAATIARLQEELGHPLASFVDWLQISADEMPVVLEAGLEPNHEDADQIAASICDSLETEAFDRLVETLSVAVFPRAVERYHGVLALLQSEVSGAPTAEVAAA